MIDCNGARSHASCRAEVQLDSATADAFSAINLEDFPASMLHPFQDQITGLTLRRAFRYDWRMWTLPEIRELLAEAGFRHSRVHLQDWDDDAGEALSTYSPSARFENQSGWLAYVVGLA